MRTCLNRVYTAFFSFFVIFLVSAEIYADYKIVYLIADHVNIRSTASKDAKIIAVLPINSELSILQTTDLEMVLNNYKAPWLKVRFHYKEKSGEGYVWKGLTTDTHIEKDGVTYLLGIENVNKDNHIIYQLRAAKGNYQIDKLSFIGIGSLSTFHDLKVNGNKGLNKVKAVININFSDDMCAGAFGDVIIFWNGTKLIHAITLNHGYDAPMFYEESLTFPDETDGKPGTVIWKARGGEHNDDGSDTIETDKKETYIWDGKQLKKK